MKYIFNIYGFVFFLFVALTSYITYPLLFNMTTVVSSLGDEYLIIWIQNWVIHSLFNNPFSLFNANIYFPYPYSLGYSDTFITTAIFASPFLHFFQEPVITFNITLFSAFIMLGFSVFCLAYYVTKDACMSFLSGVMVVFSPVVLDKMTHIQVLSIWGVPFAILFFLRYFHERKLRYLTYALIVFILQSYNSFLPGYFILFSWICICIVYYNKKLLPGLFFSRKVAFLIVLCAISFLPLLLPYIHMKKELLFTRDIRDTIHYGLHFEDLVVGNSYTRMENFLKHTFPQNIYKDQSQIKVGYPGLLFFFLGVPALLYTLFVWKKLREYLILTLITCLGFVLALGPALHFARQTIHQPFPIILPYALFYYVVPGFDGMRNSARWEMLAIIGGSVLIALFITQISKKFSDREKLLMYFFIGTCLLLEFVNPDRFVPITQQNNFPPVYRYIENNLSDDATIIEFPIYPWYMKYSYEELRREYFSTIHFRKMVNGYSGFSPAEWLSLVGGVLQTFPQKEALSTLNAMGVEYIILHKDEFTRLNSEEIMTEGRIYLSGEQIEKLLQRDKRVRLIKVVDTNTSIYHLE